MPRRRRGSGPGPLEPVRRPALARERPRRRRLRPRRRARGTVRRLLASRPRPDRPDGVRRRGPAGGEDGDEYLVRAVFDNGSFIVPGEDVRIAGANAGVVDSVDVSLPGEVVSRDARRARAGRQGDRRAARSPSPAFQDFRADASCILRPQSLIGERYVACRPSRPRPPEGPAAAAAGADPRRRARSGPVPAAAREQRQDGRHRPGPERDADADPRAPAPDPQRPRRRVRRPRRGDRRDRPAGRPDPARRRPRARDPRRTSGASSPTWRPTPSASSRR